MLLRTRLTVSETSFVDIKIWRVPLPVRMSLHQFKYSLALVSNGLCVLRYDNEAGKGDQSMLVKRKFLTPLKAWRNFRMISGRMWIDG